MNEGGVYVQRGVRVSADPIVRPPAATVGEIAITRMRSVEDLEAENGRLRLRVAELEREVDELRARG